MIDAMCDTIGRSVLDKVVTLAQRLRRAGVNVSVGQMLDALRALAVVDLGDRAQIRAALLSTMVKQTEHQAVFDALFRSVFLPAPPVHPESDVAVDPADLDDRLARALHAGDMDALRALADFAVAAFGGLDSEEPSGERYHVRRTLHRLELSRLLSRAVRMAGDDVPVEGLQARVAALEEMVVTETRRRLRPLSDQLDLEPVDGVDDLDFVDASAADLARLREALRPLARRVGARLARQRQRRSSARLDMRRTLRRSLASGGAPIDLVFERRKPVRPQLVVLADVSGSVAEFARFFLVLLHALHAELAHVRSFCFVDGVDEVTHLLATLPDRLEIRHLLLNTRVVDGSGHSDYGAVFQRFTERHSDVLSPRTTLLVAGDARSNGRDPGTGTLDAIRQQVRRLYWLNPEPRQLWDSRDSAMSAYAAHCDAAVEVRNARQLGEFVLSLT
jgi:uncharacterized protein